ncbi:MAG TPA: hypothetical protein GXZ43_03080 [Clostridiaceae bacterium]|nr:hypothetical protein [Clostridiaceae bacterium]
MSGNMILNQIWVSYTFFEDSMTSSLINKVKRNSLEDAYVIWEEANKTILNSGDNIEKLNQGFLSLKRAFNVTSKSLKENLGINEIHYTGKKSNKKFLDVLEHFEIIKTITIEKYLTLRNLIEHDNKEPPSREDCLSLSEYIWNYIRNSASILKNFIECFCFSPLTNEKGTLEFSYVISNKRGVFTPHLNVTACINRKYISFIRLDDTIEIDNICLISKYENDSDLIRIKKFDTDSLQYILFRGEISNQDFIVNYIKHMVLPEYGGIDENNIRRIFR